MSDVVRVLLSASLLAIAGCSSSKSPGPAEGGQWLTERRNHLNDFKWAFGTEPTTLEAIALMTDTDNTGTQATAWWSGVRFMPGSPRPAQGAAPLS